MKKFYPYILGFITGIALIAIMYIARNKPNEVHDDDKLIVAMMLPTEAEKVSAAEPWYQTKKADYYSIAMDFKSIEQKKIVADRAWKDIKHEDAFVRSTALIALAKLKDPRAKEAFKTIAEDKDNLVADTKTGLKTKYPSLQ